MTTSAVRLGHQPAGRTARLRAGEIVLSGGLTAADPVGPGDVVVVSVDRLGLDGARLQVVQGGRLMPLIQVTLGKGRSPEQLQALGEAITAAVEGRSGRRVSRSAWC